MLQDSDRDHTAEVHVFLLGNPQASPVPFAQWHYPYHCKVTETGPNNTLKQHIIYSYSCFSSRLLGVFESETGWTQHALAKSKILLLARVPVLSKDISDLL